MRKSNGKTKRVAETKGVANRKLNIDLPFSTIAIVIALWLGISILFYSGNFLKPQELTLGQQAPETIVASVDFYAETISATELAKNARAEEILPVFRIDDTAIASAESFLSKLLPSVQNLKNTEDEKQRALIVDLINARLEQQSIKLTPDELVEIIPENKIDLERILLDAISDPIEQGIITEQAIATRFNNLTPDEAIIIQNNSSETIHSLNAFIIQEDAIAHITKAICNQVPSENCNPDVIRTLISPWVKPNIVYDEETTKERKEEAIEFVDPVLELIGRGSILIRNGDPVSEQTLIWLKAHDERVSKLEPPVKRVLRTLARSIILLFGLCLTFSIAELTSRNLLHNRRRTLIFLTICALSLTVGKLMSLINLNLQIAPSSIFSYALPLSLAPILATILLGNNAAILAGLLTSFAFSTLQGNRYEVLVVGMLVSVVAIYATQNVKKRSTLFRAGLAIGTIKVLFVLVLALLNQPSWIIIFYQFVTALVSGFIWALLVLLLVPLFEHFFKITTDIKLLELSDLSHPLLQSLAINAPGTYHHSLTMASLAQSAAEAIGANGLQLRVCAYFHDVGKLAKPEFFTENIQYTENPHDDLAPSMSTLVIVAHVKEGVSLVRKHKLPEVITDGIKQHHGTSLVSTFYQRAKAIQEQEADSKNGVSDKDYRYEGPKPQTKEMAILMLADSCEAASRSLEKPSHVRIANLISDIFSSRLQDGQLNECGLTLRELNIVRKSFTFSLTNMLHERTPYQKETDKNNE